MRVNGDPSKRAAALATLSADMGRIARLLEGIASRGGGNFEGDPALHAKIRRAICRRKYRRQIFGEALFGNPGWEMMLDLADAKLSGRQLSVSAVCLAAACPPTTALRHLRRLVDAGLVARHPDPADGRRVYTSLTDKGARLLALHFDDDTPVRAAAGRPA